MIRTILIALMITLATHVGGEEDNPLGITVYGSFLHTKQVPNALFFFNDIERNDSFELRRALRNHEIDTVVLGSDGGSVWEGLNMAGIIHDKGIATYVPELPEKMGCYSACSFMFFGGKLRKADGVLAVHQAGSYRSERDVSKEKVSETQQYTQFTVSEIIGFLNEFETPPWVFEKMFRSRNFYEFDKDEKERLASRSDEMSIENLNRVNLFIESFFKYLDDLEVDKKKAEVEKIAQISNEEQLRSIVVEIQKLLNAAGCNAGVADGIWGRRTQAAAVLFAKTANLPTKKEELLSEKFVQKLRGSPANFCPKPPVSVGPFYSSYKYTCAAGQLPSKLRLTSYQSGRAKLIDEAIGREITVTNILQLTGAFSFKNFSGTVRFARDSAGRITAMSFGMTENNLSKNCKAFR